MEQTERFTLQRSGLRTVRGGRNQKTVIKNISNNKQCKNSKKEGVKICKSLKEF